MKRFWQDWEIEVVRAVYPYVSTAKLADAMGCTRDQIYRLADRLALKKTAAYLASPDACRMRRGDKLGAAFRFKPGHATWNKGTRYVAGGRSAETRFKPGTRPHTWRPIGSERVSKEGYLQRKIADTGCTRRDYVGVHHLVWRLHGLEVPAGHALVFRDGDKRNFDINNLELISRRELMSRNTVHRLPKELALVVQLKGAVQRQINKRERRAA